MRHRHTVVGMISILSAVVSLLSFRVRRRASLELELIALRHQVTAATAAPRSASAILHKPAPLSLAIPGLAAGPERHGAGQAGNGGPVGSQGLPAVVSENPIRSAIALRARPAVMILPP